ncbi:hypothetical protein DNTS_005005 [Danionella cerebrum]|uniref:EF-hand domain-containing protein n=1 Tax=Danionella cerebrum TaxID=2873325 RepID=A0A553Q9P2_9TELE|nr:hypothetical protein DNTS_005005 [Danionella translucida]
MSGSERSRQAFEGQFYCSSIINDGKLSLDEFQAFFSDGTLNEEELEKLFHTIDSDNTRTQSSSSYYYFANHMGDYEGVLASLETLNLAILKAMDFTKKVSVPTIYHHTHQYRVQHGAESHMPRS